jgi:hypothetical protein
MKSGETTNRTQTTTTRILPQAPIEPKPLGTGQTNIPVEVQTNLAPREQGALAPHFTALGRSASVVTTLLDQQAASDEPKRRGRGRTGALREVSKETLIAESRKPLVRQSIRGVVDLHDDLGQALLRFEAQK